MSLCNNLIVHCRGRCSCRWIIFSSASILCKCIPSKTKDIFYFTWSKGNFLQYCSQPYLSGGAKWKNLPDFCLFFLIFLFFPIFSLFFLIFGKFFAFKGVLCPHWPPRWLCHWFLGHIHNLDAGGRLQNNVEVLPTKVLRARNSARIRESILAMILVASRYENQFLHWNV